MRSEVFTVVNDETVILWDVMLCALVDGYQEEHNHCHLRRMVPLECW